ncbi:MAG: xylulokinase [Armatimonadetes bacterium]|nr:xylulokinase [Armatimonadota bacterium]
MARLLGIDVGTSCAKAVVIDETGLILGQTASDYPLAAPRPGWAEQDPETWWAAVERCLGRLEPPFDAIGVTGQMHGSVFLDGDDRVIRPALLWCDQRTAAECRWIESAVGPGRLRQVTCNPMLTGFQLPKTVWLRNHEPEAYSQVRRVLLPKDYVVRRLTGAFSSDFSDASGTGLLDVPRKRWSTEVAQAVDVPLEWLPDVHDSTAVIGSTKDGIPVVAGAGDQAAGAVGVGAVGVGNVSVSLGTSGVAFAPVDAPKADPEGSVHVFCHADGGWHAMGVMLSCGGAVRWARDTFFPGATFQEWDEAAERCDPGAGGVFFDPYLAGERCPFVDPEARGALCGLSLSTGRDQIARAVMEGVTVGIVECLAALERFAPRPCRIRVTGGGAQSPFWTSLLSDTSGMECATMRSDEGPCVGAAVLAGVGVGVWDDVASAVKVTAQERGCRQPHGHDPSGLVQRYRNRRALRV